MKRGVIAPTLTMLVALAMLIALGTWQLARKSEKEALVAAVEARAFGAAVALPASDLWASLDLDRLDFQKVRLEGRFRTTPEFHLYTIVTDPRSRLAQPGWMIYQPFDLTRGGTIMVGRGAVPEALKDVARRPGSGAPEGVVTLEGLVRRPEPRGWFAAADDRTRNTWFTRDARAFAASAGLAGAAPFTVEQSTPNPGGLPHAGTTRVTFPNRHLEYALTWYGLALTLVGVWAVYIRRILRGEGQPPARQS